MAFTENTLSLKEKYFLLFAFVLYVISLFINLGAQPLYLEEPRRALIALEMIFNKNFIVPTEFGELYFKKPPLWNWMIILSYKIFGSYSEFATRFFTPVSLILMGGLIYLMGKKYVSQRFGILSAFLFLVSIDIYFYFSLLGEIDIFYSLITLGGFFTIFHFYKKQRWYLLFISTYILAALGLLTKAFPTLVFTGLSLLLFFLYTKKFRILFRLPHFTGIFVFLIIIGGYFYLYSRNNDPGDFLNILWSRSAKRTVLENNSLTFLKNLYVFPGDLLKNIFPALLFVPLLFFKGFRKILRSNDYIQFSLYIFLGNAFIYWISPGTRQRYVYMLYPLIINVLAFFYLYIIHEKPNIHKTYKVIFTVFSILGLVFPLAIFFIPQFHEIRYVYLIGAASGLAILFSIIYNQKVLYNALYIFILILIILRISFNLTVVPYRNIHSYAKLEKDQAYLIHAKVRDNPLFLFEETTCSRSTIFYLERERRKVLARKFKLETGDFLITDNESELPDSCKEVFVFQQPKNKKYKLIEVQ